jgi:hypothetical protein
MYTLHRDTIEPIYKLKTCLKEMGNTIKYGYKSYKKSPYWVYGQELTV